MVCRLFPDESSHQLRLEAVSETLDVTPCDHLPVWSVFRSFCIFTASWLLLVYIHNALNINVVKVYSFWVTGKDAVAVGWLQFSWHQTFFTEILWEWQTYILTPEFEQKWPKSVRVQIFTRPLFLNDSTEMQLSVFRLSLFDLLTSALTLAPCSRKSIMLQSKIACWLMNTEISNFFTEHPVESAINLLKQDLSNSILFYSILFLLLYHSYSRLEPGIRLNT